MKNSKNNICNYEIPYLDINEEICSDYKNLIEECKQKMIEITGIPKERLNYD